MSKRLRGFTLVELLVVLGLISILISLLLPVVARAKAAANAAACLSNLRQIATAWTMYTAEHRGHLLGYVEKATATPDVAWNGYWLGALERYNVRGDMLLCPSAREATSVSSKKGFGNVVTAWTGKFASLGTVVRLNPSTYREGSYGYNRYLTTRPKGIGLEYRPTKLTAVKETSNVPLLMDCIYIDAEPDNGSEDIPVALPPNFSGESVTGGSDQHWRFLIKRHNNGINVAMADGSARWVALEDTYMLKWKSDWMKYRLEIRGL